LLNRPFDVRDSDLFALLERTADAAFTVDQNGVIQSWNAAAERLFGATAATVIGRPCDQVLQGTDALGVRACTPDCAVRWCALQEAGIHDFDLAVHTATRPPLWINVSTLVSADSRTGRTLIVHLARDASAVREREDLVRAAAAFAQQLAGTAEPASRLPPVTPLTRQETRILRLLAEGRPAAEISRQLRISPRTLRTHIHHVNRKLHARNRLEAVVHAIRRGIIGTPGASPARRRRS
jgi:DNA-binding CsgD family transcriptional regulator